MVSFTKIAVAASLALAVAAGDGGVQIYHKDQLTIDACTAVFKKSVIFYKKDKKGFCNVKNQPALGTMAMCLKLMPHPNAIPFFIDSCAKYNLTTEDFEASLANATKYAVSLKNLTDIPGYNLTKPFYYPVKFPEKKLRGAYDSTLGRWYNYNRANYYGWVLLSYWFVLILLAGVCRFASFVAPKFVQSFNGKISNTYRRYITMPALAGRKKAEHLKFLKVFEAVVPSRMESIHIFIWFILCLAFNVGNYHHDSPNIIWKVESAEMGRKIADRTGIMCLYMIPQLVLFAGRNNFTQWISGWSYARFNVIHHWYGRIAFVLMILHAVGMTYNGVGIGKYESRNAKPYVRWGYVAIIAAAIMLFHSLAVIRKNNYEGFVVAHNVLAAIFIAGVWIHTREDGFQMFMYAATAVWGFDKVVRIVRCFWFGVKTAEVQLIAEETLKVKIPRSAHWKTFPLSHLFIYFFRPTCFWQSHPFTVVDLALDANTITFYIKVKGGMSHGLYKYLSTQPEQKANIKCTVEGPYGTQEPLQHYSSVAFLAGGNGVPGLYAGALDLTRKSSTQKLKLYWIIRHWKSVEWFYEELKRLQGTSVEPIVYVTQYDTPLDKCFIEKFEESDASSEEKKSDSELSTDHVENLKTKLSFVDFRAGRPDISAIVNGEIAESTGSVAFVACGHNSFVDEARKITIASLPEGKRVDFFDQMQTW